VAFFPEPIKSLEHISLTSVFSTFRLEGEHVAREGRARLPFVTPVRRFVTPNLQFSRTTLEASPVAP